MKSIYILLAFVSSFFLGNCSFSPSSFSTTEDEIATRHYNIAYGNDELQTLDLCLPKKLSDSTTMVILVHGGAWFFGEKETLRPMQEFLAQHNIASANINYRLNRGDITYKEQVEDIDLAVSYLREQRDSLKLPCRFVLFGESAGAHLSLLYGYKNPQCIEKIISLSAPTDFYSKNYINRRIYHWYTKFIFEKVAGANYTKKQITKNFREASPISQVSNVPTLIFQGTNDFIVDKSQALSLDTALTQQKIPHKLVLMKGGIHVSRRLPWWRDGVIYPEMLKFIKNKLVKEKKILTKK